MASQTDRSFFVFCAICAFIGTATTLVNTVLPWFMPPAGGGASQAQLVDNPLYMARQWTMLVHAPATLIPILGLALALWRRSPGWCALGFVWTLFEKLLELVGQAVIIFTVNLDWRRQLTRSNPPADLQTRIDTVLGAWDDVYIVLWLSGGCAALCFAYVFAIEARRSRRFLDALLIALMLGGAAGSVLLFAADYGQQSWAGDLVSWIYPPIMTGLRLTIAVWLWRFASNLASDTESDDGLSP